MSAKTAIVTGASKGIGRAIARALAADGFDLALCARNANGLANTANEIRAAFPNCQILTFSADLSQRAETLNFAKMIQENWTRCDVLVNNAGIFLAGSIADEPEDQLEQLISTNLYSAYHLTRGVLPLVKAAEGHVFNMCSVASVKAYPNGGSYSISKFALLGFSKCLREELRDQRVKVTSILPGATWSDSWAGVELPQDRLMEADDVAKSIIAALHLSKTAVIEELVLRPQLGDL